MTTANDLIRDSAQHSEIVHADYDDDLAEELSLRSDNGGTRTGDETEYWGSNWRVHLTHHDDPRERDDMPENPDDGKPDSVPAAATNGETLPGYLRRVASDLNASGSDCTADDYRAMARAIERMQCCLRYCRNGALARKDRMTAAQIKMVLNECRDIQAALTWAGQPVATGGAA